MADSTTTAICRDPKVRGGRAVLRGTGFPIANMLAELSEGPGPKHLADEFDLPEDVIREALMELAKQTWWR